MRTTWQFRRGSAGLACFALAAASAAAPAPLPGGGIYGKAQSARGQAVYRVHCAGCHGTRLDGGAAPPLKGPFWTSWKGRSLGELYRLIQGSMPADAPSSLSDADYAAITAYMLEVGGYPAGPRDLPESIDALAALRIEPHK